MNSLHVTVRMPHWREQATNVFRPAIHDLEARIAGVYHSRREHFFWRRYTPRHMLSIPPVTTSELVVTHREHGTNVRRLVKVRNPTSFSGTSSSGVRDATRTVQHMLGDRRPSAPAGYLGPTQGRAIRGCFAIS